MQVEPARARRSPNWSSPVWRPSPAPTGLYLQIAVDNRGRGLTKGEGVLTLADDGLRAEVSASTPSCPGTSIAYPIKWTDKRPWMATIPPTWRSATATAWPCGTGSSGWARRSVTSRPTARSTRQPRPRRAAGSPSCPCSVVSWSPSSSSAVASSSGEGGRGGQPGARADGLVVAAHGWRTSGGGLDSWSPWWRRPSAPFPGSAAAALAPVALGEARARSPALAATTVTRAPGASQVTGDIGVSPGTAVTGFPPGTLTGSIHPGDPVATQAQADLAAAYADAVARPLDDDL